ncbi:hypothetical protein CEUSTIGMA_g9389.t1 [Chlamydomonas eustigma]|uniref:Uncharacterized protein n=1 Tax=Chlamydomonas eustigma TaxID=1157962 RepID=A0A250XFW0_9CHLO|nr:hypothetical protein CEUSTIGMA_g9389.t1 [Chlamydomonas eustigma]|eukprot:GAX81961.1 hypothetical protein CEUSTIGMA_g9389.t1 [Chlamydomonas eustigma]
MYNFKLCQVITVTILLSALRACNANYAYIFLGANVYCNGNFLPVIPGLIKWSCKSGTSNVLIVGTPPPSVPYGYLAYYDNCRAGTCDNTISCTAIIDSTLNSDIPQNGFFNGNSSSGGTVVSGSILNNRADFLVKANYTNNAGSDRTQNKMITLNLNYACGASALTVPSPPPYDPPCTLCSSFCVTSPPRNSNEPPVPSTSNCTALASYMEIYSQNALSALEAGLSFACTSTNSTCVTVCTMGSSIFTGTVCAAMTHSPLTLLELAGALSPYSQFTCGMGYTVMDSCSTCSAPLTPNACQDSSPPSPPTSPSPPRPPPPKPSPPHPSPPKPSPPHPSPPTPSLPTPPACQVCTTFCVQFRPTNNLQPPLPTTGDCPNLAKVMNAYSATFAGSPMSFSCSNINTTCVTACASGSPLSTSAVCREIQSQGPLAIPILASELTHYNGPTISSGCGLALLAADSCSSCRVSSTSLACQDYSPPNPPTPSPTPPPPSPPSPSPPPPSPPPPPPSPSPPSRPPPSPPPPSPPPPPPPSPPPPSPPPPPPPSPPPPPPPPSPPPPPPPKCQPTLSECTSNQLCSNCLNQANPLYQDTGLLNVCGSCLCPNVDTSIQSSCYNCLSWGRPLNSNGQYCTKCSNLYDIPSLGGPAAADQCFSCTVDLDNVCTQQYSCANPPNMTSSGQPYNASVPEIMTCWQCMTLHKWYVWGTYTCGDPVMNSQVDTTITNPLPV